ncbi:hypothetical protein HZ994_13500 [Akkermansiaceae bacterium]|nr:hypothetical protein HZ994_13500 [Akkermansiaceae bacterium]
MNPKPLSVLGVMFVAIVVNSCAPNFQPPLPSADLLAGESDASKIVWNKPVPGRPGLATGWGDEKKSEMGYVSFERASSKPAGTDVIFYNTPEGIDAMSNSKSRVGALQRASGSMVEWGIKGGSGYLPSYKEYGHGRRLVAGKKGSSYTIVVKNRCKSSLEIVASVDGLDVMDGKTASFSKRGYIIDPGEAVEIGGFRTSRHRVAAFEFSGVSDSYANLRHGDTRNIGVIGIAVFTQKGVDPWRWSSGEVHRRNSASPFAEAP